MLEASIGAMATDETLVQLAREGDRSAQEELFRRHWLGAYRVAYRLLGNDQDAQDATQESMIKALSHLGDFGERSGFRTWLMRIVTNAAFDAGRRRKRRATVGLGASEGEISHFEPATPRSMVQRLLNNLSGFCKKPEQALPYLDLSVSIDPESSEERLQRAWFRKKSGDIAGTKEDLETLMSQKPEDLDMRKIQMLYREWFGE